MDALFWLTLARTFPETVSRRREGNDGRRNRLFSKMGRTISRKRSPDLSLIDTGFKFRVTFVRTLPGMANGTKSLVMRPGAQWAILFLDFFGF